MIKPLYFPNDLIRLLYWVFFKPFTLDIYIHQINPALSRHPDMFTLWRDSQKYPELRSLINLSFFFILVAPLLAIPIAILLTLVGFEVEWFNLIYGVIFVEMIGIVGGMLYSVDGGIALSVVGGMVVSLVNSNVSSFISYAYGSAWGFVVFNPIVEFSINTMSFIINTGYIVGIGITYGILLGIFLGPIVGTWRGVLWGVLFSMGIAVGLSYNTYNALGILFIVISCVFGFLFSCLRIPLYLCESLIVWLAARRGNLTWRYSPALWDELIWFPLPGLDEQLIAIGKQDRATGLEAITAIGASFQQGWAARRALGELTLGSVQSARSLEKISNIFETLTWLPSGARDQLKDFLSGIEQISQHARAALESDTLYNRQEQLRQALTISKKLREGFAYYADQRFAQQAGPAMQTWEQVFDHELQAANQKEQIPNVYVAGSSLAEQSKVFKGRRDVFRALERELATESEQRPAILLFGARRVGKTSALKQLSVALGPQVVPVSIDMQSLALTNDAATLFSSMAATIKSGAFASRRVDLPGLTRESLQADPYSGFADWFQSVEKALDGFWMLLCLDEYEYLEKMLADGRVDERAFQLLRSLLQNNPHLTLLFSGAHTFETLQPIWSHHLINVRTLQIGHLDLQDARELVERPIPEFPMRYGVGALEQVLSVLGGQPFLLQAVCRDLVNLLNEEDRLEARKQDIQRAFDSALVSASAYFTDLWLGPDTNDAQRAILSALAVARGAALTEETVRNLGTSADLRRLLQHDVIAKFDNGYRFKVELVRQWVESQL